MSGERLHIAYISPMPPTPSGISDYSELLVPFLAAHMDIAVFYDGEEPPKRAGQYPVYPIDELYNRYSCYDLRLYQMGNSPHHRNSFLTFRSLPGVAVLHEPFLHHGLYGSSPLHFYRREAFYDLGRPDWSRLKHWELCLWEDDRQSLIEYPLIGRIVDTALGIVVHSRAALQIIDNVASRQRSRPQKARIIPQPVEILFCDSAECRAQLGLPQDALIFGVAGFVHPVKEPFLILQAFARLTVEIPQNAYLLFVGEVLRETGDIMAIANELGVGSRVIILGRVEPLERLHQAMGACDIIINLRRQTIGETSATALRAMALGKPTIVRSIGWFDELPDHTCAKIGPEAGIEELTATMRFLAGSSEKRLHLGLEARRYIQRECDPRRVAGLYAEFLREVYWSIVRPGSGSP